MILETTGLDMKFARIHIDVRERRFEGLPFGMQTERILNRAHVVVEREQGPKSGFD